ncbi:hypothetical protein NDU88_002365 [Pleurodeles waltl]|uniref:RNase H type-1 domain-containing protein n=1 Tax=Pleurodeles waltl TaxID=8319 RepID=A0AAV7WS46_PLEWA|nr:hypothetical protein NDU88_002365 [Pleurodeles waltl]
MTNARLTRYETIILGSPNVSLKRCTRLNPATLLPIENAEISNTEEVEHDCLEVTELCAKPRPDIKDTQLEENDYIMFVDGSCLRDSVGILRAGYAVCTITGILEASWLERVYYAQVAELIALTKACHAAVNLKVTIYTDSRYGFGIVHDFGQLWSQRGFMTSSGSPVKNGEQIKDLLHAIQLPLEIAVVKCNAHVKSQDFVSIGNGYADQVARWSEEVVFGPTLEGAISGNTDNNHYCEMCRHSKLDTCSHTKKVTCPTDEELEVSDSAIPKKEVSGPKNIQRGTETEGEPTEGGLVPQTVNEFERGDNEPISVEAAGELSQGEVLPEVDSYGLELELVTDPEDEGERAEGGQSTSTPPEPLADPSRENTIAQEEGAVQRAEKPSRKKKTHKGDNWPKKQTAREKVIPGDTIEEEIDTTRREDLSEGELQSERRLKRKRVANRRYTGPEWADATTSEWQQEFLAFCFNEWYQANNTAPEINQRKRLCLIEIES